MLMVYSFRNAKISIIHAINGRLNVTLKGMLPSNRAKCRTCPASCDWVAQDDSNNHTGPELL